jgi:hypothetical protein
MPAAGSLLHEMVRTRWVIAISYADLIFVVLCLSHRVPPDLNPRCIAGLQSDIRRAFYFQLQLGIKLSPPCVSSCC